MASRMVIPDGGKVTMANLLMQKYIISANPILTIGLFQNNYTPISSSVYSDFTVATFSGYVNKTISNTANFLLATLVAGKGRITYNTNQQWTQTTVVITNTVYGYFVYLDGSTITPNQQLLCAERFDTSVAFNVAGTTLALTPQFDLTLDP